MFQRAVPVEVLGEAPGLRLSRLALPPPLLPPPLLPPPFECDYIPRENCTKIAGSRNCKQIPREVPEQICIEGIPVQKVREECNDVTRQGRTIKPCRVMFVHYF